VWARSDAPDLVHPAGASPSLASAAPLLEMLLFPVDGEG
jgi:hypothetical protein